MPTTKTPTSFHSLPAELRNKIHELSGCLDILQCPDCGRSIRMDNNEVDPSKNLIDLWYHGEAYNGRQSDVDLPAYLRVNRATEDLHGHSRHPYLMRFEGDLRFQFRKTACKTVGVAQPLLTRVSKQVRADTLPIFYEKHTFYFTLFDEQPEHGTIVRWLRRNGRKNAALLRQIVVVYSKKADPHDIKRNLQPGLAKLGVRGGDGVVRLQRVKYGGCRCNDCVMRTLTSRENELDA